jgi:hypothetical protein
MVDGDRRLTYAQLLARRDRWSSALQVLGSQPGDRFAYIASNTHAYLEASYAIPQNAETKQQVAERRKVFLRKWRLKCRAVVDSLEEVGDRLFTFTRFPKERWKSIRPTPSVAGMKSSNDELI